jgi:hypothetical protein
LTLLPWSEARVRFVVTVGGAVSGLSGLVAVVAVVELVAAVVLVSRR